MDCILILTSISIPAALIGSSPAEFCGIGDNNTPSFIFQNVIFQSAGIYIFWAFCIYFLFGKKVQTLLAFVMSFAALSAVLNAYIFQGHYGDISATFTFLNVTDFETFGLKSIVNLLFTLLLLVFLCLFAAKKEGTHLVSVCLRGFFVFF